MPSAPGASGGRRVDLEAERIGREPGADRPNAPPGKIQHKSTATCPADRCDTPPTRSQLCAGPDGLAVNDVRTVTLRQRTTVHHPPGPTAASS